MHCTWPMGPIESHEKKVFRKNPNMDLQAILRRWQFFNISYPTPFRRQFFTAIQCPPPPSYELPTYQMDGP